MKKNYLIIIIVILVAWNILLTANVSDLRAHEKRPNYIIEEHRVSGFSTDLTEVAEKIGNACVTVQTANGTGSGVIFEQKGNKFYVVTAYHVVMDSDYMLQINLDNFTSLQATIVGYDKVKDVAVLSAECNYKVDVLEFGDSSILNKGEYVLAIGSPLGLDFNGSMSLGIVSSNNRILSTKVEGVTYYNNMVQSDVKLDMGQSGGALVNMDGELVALNTGVITSNNSSMTFSIPVDELKYICEHLVSDGEVKRLELGLKLHPIEDMHNYQKTALGYGLDQVDGMYISNVTYASIAEKLGLKKGDALIKINDYAINNYDSLYKAIYSREELKSISVLRNDELVTVGVGQ